MPMMSRQPSNWLWCWCYGGIIHCVGTGHSRMCVTQISRRSAMELDRPSMREVRPARAPSAASQEPSQEPLAKSAVLPELAAPAQPSQLPTDTMQASQPDQVPEPEPRMRLSLSADDLQSQASAKRAQSNQSIQELVEVLDLCQDKPSSQEPIKKPEEKPAEQKPEQANKWLAFQKLVSQQAAEEAALQEVGVPCIQHSICHQLSVG